MKVLVISGSTRRQSLNSTLAELVPLVRPADEVRVIKDLAELAFYDADVEAAGPPAAVRLLRDAVAAADAVVLVTPEYNGTPPGVLVNAIDWLSRPHGRSPFQDKPVTVLSASPGRGGGRRSAEHLRAVLARVGARVSPEGLALAQAHRQLAGQPPRPELLGDLRGVLDGALADVVPARGGAEHAGDAEDAA